MSVIWPVWSKINIGAKAYKSSSCTFVITCLSGCMVPFCDVEAMTRPRSHGTVICVNQQPVIRCRTVDFCE